MVVRIRKRGKAYQLDYTTPSGRRRRLTVGNSLDHAQRLALKYSAWLVEGKDPEREFERATTLESVSSTTISNFYPIFLKRHASMMRYKTQISYQTSFNNIKRYPGLLNIELHDLRKSIVKIICMHGSMRAFPLHRSIARRHFYPA